MTAQYRITEDDYAAAVSFHAWRSFTAALGRWWLAFAGAIVVILLVVDISAPRATALGVASGAAAFAIYVACFQLLWLFVWIPIRARRHYRKYKAVQEPITVELTDASIEFNSSVGNAILPWSKILHWRQSDRFVLIYPMPVMFHIVPKSIASDGFDVSMLIRRLGENVGAER